MSHKIICFLWAAFNTGAERLTLAVGRGKSARDETFRVTPERKGANVRYRGASIYSWGWWEMARFVTAPSGERVVLRRSDSYSASTSRHFYHMDRALGAQAGLRVFRFPIGKETPDMPDRPGAEALQSYCERITEAFNNALRARLPEKAERYIGAAGELSDEMRAMIEAFGMDAPLWADPFESDPARRDELERKLTELGIRTGRPINVYWRQP